MKSKSNLKMFLVVGIVLVTMCVICTNTVNATNVLENNTTEQTIGTDKTVGTPETQKEKAQRILTLIPNTITLDATEFDYMERSKFDIVNTTIRTLLKDETNIGIGGLSIDPNILNISCTPDMENRDISTKAFKAEFRIYLWKNMTSETLAEKEISIKFKNSESYNTTDEKYIKTQMENFDTSLKVHEYELLSDFNTFFDNTINTFENTLKKQFNEKNIQYLLNGGGGSSDFNNTFFYELPLFKNSIYYTTAEFKGFKTQVKITVPDNIMDTEEDYKNYAISQIKEYYKGGDYKDSDFKFTKVKDNYYGLTVDGENWFEGNDNNLILLKKANTTKVIDNVTISTNSNVSITGTILDKNNSVYTEMLEKAKAKGYSNIFCSYELKSSSNIKDGLTITFSLGTDNNGKQAIVLHKKADGSYEEFIKTVKDGKIEITVTELSPFMVALNDNRTLDDEPKTGAENHVLFISAIALLSIGGLAVLKFKKQ